MKNDIKLELELELSEEQLQEITGGCAQCVTDRSLAVHYNLVANDTLALANDAAQQARKNQDLKERESLLNVASSYQMIAHNRLTESQKLLNVVAARVHL